MIRKINEIFKSKRVNNSQVMVDLGKARRHIINTFIRHLVVVAAVVVAAVAVEVDTNPRIMLWLWMHWRCWHFYFSSKCCSLVWRSRWRLWIQRYISLESKWFQFVISSKMLCFFKHLKNFFRFYALWFNHLFKTVNYFLDSLYFRWW